MSSYTVDHKYASRNVSTKTFGELKYCNSLGVFYAPRWLSNISDQRRPRGIIVKYTPAFMYSDWLYFLLYGIRCHKLIRIDAECGVGPNDIFRVNIKI